MAVSHLVGLGMGSLGEFAQVLGTPTVVVGGGRGNRNSLRINPAASTARVLDPRPKTTTWEAPADPDSSSRAVVTIWTKAAPVLARRIVLGRGAPSVTTGGSSSMLTVRGRGVPEVTHPGRSTAAVVHNTSRGDNSA